MPWVSLFLHVLLTRYPKEHDGAILQLLCFALPEYMWKHSLLMAQMFVLT